jgi:hypothetical protein
MTDYGLRIESGDAGDAGDAGDTGDDTGDTGGRRRIDRSDITILH